VLVATAVEKDWKPEEMGALAAYLARGGQVLAMPFLPDPEPDLLTENPDPAMVATYLDQVTQNFNLGLQIFGVWAGPLPVVETDEDHIYPSVPPQAFMLSAPGFQPHAITQPLGGMIATQNTPPLILMEVEGVEMSPLLVTTLGGTARAPQPDLSWEPLEAPIMVGAALEILDPGFIQGDEEGRAGGRMAVLGSPWIAANALIYESPWNKDLVLNTIAWLADEEVQVASRVSSNTPTPPMLSNADVDTVQQVTVLFIPGLALLCAMGTWIRRRSL
jgi:hypothetical protein